MKRCCWVGLVLAILVLCRTASSEREWGFWDEPQKPRDVQPDPQQQPQKEATTGDPYKDGLKYYEAKDYANAFSCFKRAADAGNAEAMYMLAECYDKGNGVAQNSRTASDHYFAAASRGVPDAQLKMAQKYELGDGVDKDLAKALDWYQRAAQGGSPDALLKLGLVLIEQGQVEQAADCLSRAGKAFLKRGNRTGARECRDKLAEIGATAMANELKELIFQTPQDPSQQGPAMGLNSEEIFEICAPSCVSFMVRMKEGAALGSGFFVTTSGYLLTNNHVVDGATGNDAVQVITHDKKQYTARVIRCMPSRDLALVKIDGGPAFPALDMGNSDAVKEGAIIYTIGTPIDPALAQSINEGIVSGIRTFGETEIPSFQITALINHGNSGGPLLDTDGRVVGVCFAGLGTAVMSDTGPNIGTDIQGINFAIRINEAEELLREIGL